MINIDFLQYLIEYSKTENLSKASKNLHISQSALTRAMQKVEDYIGVPIFNRTKNSLSLNETGKELVKNALVVLEAQENMVAKTQDFYNKSMSFAIGSVAPGPMIKYGNIIYSLFSKNNIVSKIESDDILLNKLTNGYYDCIFLSRPIDSDKLVCHYAFKECLYVCLPKTHFLSRVQENVKFAEIDGQSFLVSNNLGIWDKIVEKNLPKSKFFPQEMENLNELINASTIPSFSTNISLSMRSESGRINIPIIDEDAKVDFYIVYKKQDR